MKNANRGRGIGRSMAPSSIPEYVSLPALQYPLARGPKK